MKRKLLNHLFRNRKYSMEGLEFSAEITRKEMIDYLTWWEDFMPNKLDLESLSLENLKKAVEKDYLCQNKKVALIVDKLMDFQENYMGYEAVAFDDYSHDRSLIHNSDESSDTMEGLEAVIESVHADLEKIKRNIIDFIVTVNWSIKNNWSY